MPKRIKTVYHVSPVSNIKKFRATGKHKGQQSVPMDGGGLYVAPSFKDAVTWATSYVEFKKGEVPYKSLTVYNLAIPELILSQSWFCTHWEPEFFIADEHMHEIEIVGKKTYLTKELNKLYVRHKTRGNEARWKDKDKIAQEISSTNKAASAWLRLKKEVAVVRLRCPGFSLSTKFAPSNPLQYINDILKRMERLFYEDYSAYSWCDSKRLKQYLSKEEAQGVKKLVDFCDYLILLMQSRDEFSYQDLDKRYEEIIPILVLIAK